MKVFMCQLLLSLFSLSVVDCSADGSGHFMYADFWCAIYSRDKEQVEYIIDWYYNADFTMQYNSTIGNWTGFTPAGLITAFNFNVHRYDVLQRKLERQLICVNNVDLIFTAAEESLAEPSVTLVETTGSRQDTTLVCSAHDFYPKYISLTWHRNGQEVTSGVTESEVMTNGDWTYQVHSYLEFTPGRGDKVSCVVEHASLKEPMISDWDSSLSQTDRNYVVGGVCALLLGSLCLASGIIRYVRKRRPTQVI